MKVKLINVPQLFRDIFPPYGLALINAFLNNHSINSDIFDLDIVVKQHNSLGESPSFIDLKYLRLNYSRIYDILKQKTVDKYIEAQFDNLLKKMNLKGFDVIGLNSHDNEIYTSLYLAKKIKEKEGCTIVVGGSHITRISTDRLKNLISDLNIDYVDYFVSNQPYDFFLALNENKVVAEYCGKVAILKNEKTLLDMNDYEVPLYNKEHLELYKIDASKMDAFYYRLNNELLNKFKVLQDIKNTKPVLVLPFRFMEGCNNNCSFCCFNRGGNTFKLDEDRVLSNIKTMVEKYHCKNFYFLNNNITMDKGYANSLFKRMSNEIDINWCDCASINNLDSVTIKSMADAGCIQLLFGLETASPKLLKYTNKNAGYNKLEYYTKCFEECDKNGVWVLVDLIAGLPYETSEDIKQTIDYLEYNRKTINGIFVNRFVLMKKSDFFNNPEAYKLKLIKDSHIREKIKLGSGREMDIYRKLYYRTVAFDEKEGLKWEDKQKQIENSAETLKNYVNKRFKSHFYFHYPIFLLYESFGNKMDIISFLND